MIQASRLPRLSAVRASKVIVGGQGSHFVAFRGSQRLPRTHKRGIRRVVCLQTLPRIPVTEAVTQNYTRNEIYLVCIIMNHCGPGPAFMPSRWILKGKRYDVLMIPQFRFPPEGILH